MGLMKAGLFLLVSYIASGLSFKFRSRSGRDSSPKGERLQHLRGIHSGLQPILAPSRPSWKYDEPSLPVARVVPESLIVSSADIHKYIFEPEKGVRLLPQEAKNILLAPAPTETPMYKSLTPSKPVDVQCLSSQLVVRVSKSLFKGSVSPHLKLGLCDPSSEEDDHYLFRYSYQHSCGFIKEPTPDYMSVSAMLVYNPPGPVLREVSFDIPIKCVLPRFFHSYKVGYYPLLTGGTFGLPLTPRTPFAIVAQDESGNTIAGGTSYTLGEQMFFEARRPAVTTVNPTQRLYIDKCVMTAGPSYISEPNHMVINNHGCMVDSKDTPLSKFLTANSQMVQKFSVAALVFKDAALTSSSQQLFMHCEISIAPIAATESFKACTYDQATQTWQELYGYHHTCACCDTTCPPGFVKASRNVVSSKSWKVNFKDEDGETEPQLTSLDGQKNEEMADQKGFINYWDD